MRKLKLLIVCLFTLPAVLATLQNLLPGFVAAGQSTAALAAPTNVAASDNAYATKVGVTWDAVKGATLYRVLRGATNDATTAADVGTTAAASFFDATATAGQTFFYWVRAENGASASGLSQPDQGTRANVGRGAGPSLNPPPAPAGNPVTAAKAYLGKALFWDEQLSSTRTVSCGTCHHSTNGGSDARTIIGSARALNPGADGQFNTADDVFGSPGVAANFADGTFGLSTLYGFNEQVTGRKAKSYIDAGYANSLFWDGRALPAFTDPISGAVVLPTGAALESQVLGPPVNSTEMAHAGRDWNDVAARVSASKPLALSPSVPSALNNWIAGRSYPELFAEAFGTSDVTPARIALAIATFERTLYSDQTPFDQSAQGITQLTAEQARGQGIFNGVGRCNTCHAGVLFTDDQFHNIGVRPQTEDTGRFQVTGNANDLGAFRTPSLRNVSLRAPYFHNGRFNALEDVVNFYDRGGDFNAPNIDRNRIRPIGLSPQQKSDLVAFLRGALTDPRVANGSAPFDRPTLYTESARVPQITGAGTPGSGGLIPQVNAVEPPLAGNPNFTVGVSGALGGAQAVLVIDGSDPGTGAAIPATASFARASVRLSGSGAGQGYGSVSLQIPTSAAVVGQTFYGRWFVTDASAPGGVAVTPAFKFTVFGDVAQSAPNPIDDPTFFVAQQYRDFLFREPDAAGQAAWVSVLNNCPNQFNTDANSSSAGCDRVHVSAAFFQSAEFQLKGFFVYRFYKVALNRQPTYDEIIPDMQFVTAGTTTDLNAKRDAFAGNFAARTDFIALYNSATNDSYVNALMGRYALQSITTPDPANPNGTQKVTLTRADLNSRLNVGSLTRAQVLRAVADSDEVSAAEFNPAFVSMQYFGYLRRTAEAGGFADWLRTINANPADFRSMVGGFVNSTEYRARFGQP